MYNKTLDGGENWTIVSNDAYLFDIHFVSVVTQCRITGFASSIRVHLSLVDSGMLDMDSLP